MVAISIVGVIHPPDGKQYNGQRTRHQQGSPIVEGAVRIKPDQSDHKKDQKHIRHFPHGRQVALNDVMNFVLVPGQNAVKAEEPSTKIN
ncbi:hypothetical protein D3C74_378940 [compost metagenome]